VSLHARRMRGVLAALLAALVCGSLLIAGCGGDGDDNGTTAREPPTPPPQRPPQVVIETASPGFNAAEIYRRAAPGVVTVSSIFRDGGGLLDQGSSGQGSGFVLNGRGEIVTNAHVVTQGEGANLDQADQVFVEFGDRNEVPAEVVGFDPFVDVALLRVDPEGLRLVPLRLGNDRALRVGEPVAAIGSPFGETQSLSTGVVSALHRSVESLTAFQVSEAIQTDSSINPGNSGGPLLDADARVIGINQQIRTRSGASAGVGFAVPVTAIKRSVAQLREDGSAEYAYIGVSTAEISPQLAERLGLSEDHGALISELVPNGPADDAGLRAGGREIRFQDSRITIGGDVILAIDGREVVDSADLANFISSHRPGDEVTVEVLRDDERDRVEVTLGTRPATVPSG
jgi:S1-C subfamily serine protease